MALPLAEIERLWWTFAVAPCQLNCVSGVAGESIPTGKSTTVALCTVLHATEMHHSVGPWLASPRTNTSTAAGLAAVVTAAVPLEPSCSASGRAA